MGAGLEQQWKTSGTCRVKRLRALPTSLMVGKKRAPELSDVFAQPGRGQSFATEFENWSPTL